MLRSQAFWLKYPLARQPASVIASEERLDSLGTKPLYCVTYKEENTNETLWPFRSEEKDCWVLESLYMGYSSYSWKEKGDEFLDN